MAKCTATGTSERGGQLKGVRRGPGSPSREGHWEDEGGKLKDVRRGPGSPGSPNKGGGALGG